MCLVSAKNTPCIANKDIFVYKRICFKGHFMYAPIIECLLRERPKDLVNPVTNNLTRIGEGFIHAYTECPFRELNKEIIKGVIPKGTEYYKDIDYNRIASRYIKFDVPWYQRLAMNVRDLFEKYF